MEYAALVHDDAARHRDVVGAAKAARRGDCASVTWHSAKVKQFDAEIHATVFLGDVAIRRCLETQSTPAEVAPDVVPGSGANGD